MKKLLILSVLLFSVGAMQSANACGEVFDGDSAGKEELVKKLQEDAQESNKDGDKVKGSK